MNKNKTDYEFTVDTVKAAVSYVCFVLTEQHISDETDQSDASNQHVS